jgi:4-carboxymuconolactone decarboxylase
MKLIAEVFISLSLIAWGSASAIQTAQSINIARQGSQSSRSGPAENFTGSVRVDPMFQPNAPARTSGALVTFQPGARSAWHSHPLGQTLIVTAGIGLVQQWGGPVDEIREGDVVSIPPNQKHWHGASPNSSMSHIALVEQLNGKTTEWMEKVSEPQYGASVRPRSSAAPSRAAAPDGQPTPAQRLIGDFSPKLVDLTDRVLFGEVWARPQLSQRDRSLVTVSALIAMNRPDQLRSHLARARDNGVTQEELVETITHLAFYSGWPNAITAVSVAKEVFQNRGSQ